MKSPAGLLMSRLSLSSFHEKEVMYEWMVVEGEGHRIRSKIHRPKVEWLFRDISKELKCCRKHMTSPTPIRVSPFN
jgi:hypothetical protein